jgi:uncharacterized protein
MEDKMILKIIIGLIIGFVFGYALQRTGITKYPRVMGMLLLKDFKILKFMLTAVILSMIGFHLLGELSVIKINPKPLDWGKLVGGLIFGLGMGLLGYCPGTMMARIGEGKKEALLAAFGMVAGLFIFLLYNDFFKSTFLASPIDGNLFTALGINQWLVIVPAVILFSGLIYLVNKNFSDNKKIF